MKNLTLLISSTLIFNAAHCLDFNKQECKVLIGKIPAILSNMAVRSNLSFEEHKNSIEYLTGLYKAFDRNCTKITDILISWQDIDGERGMSSDLGCNIIEKRNDFKKSLAQLPEEIENQKKKKKEKEESERLAEEKAQVNVEAFLKNLQNEHKIKQNN